MATLTTSTAKPMARFEWSSEGHTWRYTLRSDGKILSQARMHGTLEAAHVQASFPQWKAFEDDARKLRAFKRYAKRYGVAEEDVTIL